MRAVLYLLTRLSDEDVEWIAEAGKTRSLPKGTTISLQGGFDEALTFILDGVISITIDEMGDATHLTRGDMLGDMVRAGERSLSTNAKVVDPCVVLSIDRAVLNEKLTKDPAFAERLVAAFVMLKSATLSDNRLDDINRSPAQTKLRTELMENVHLAGARFSRLLKKLAVV